MNASSIRNRITPVWVAYAIVLFAATHFPVPEPLEEIVSTWDKILHASAFFVLAMLTFLALYGKPRLQPPPIRLWVGLLAYAGLDEYLQGFVNRTPDIEDWLSDALGITIAFTLSRFLARRTARAGSQQCCSTLSD